MKRKTFQQRHGHQSCGAGLAGLGPAGGFARAGQLVHHGPPALPTRVDPSFAQKASMASGLTRPNAAQPRAVMRADEGSE